MEKIAINSDSNFAVHEFFDNHESKKKINLCVSKKNHKKLTLMRKIESCQQSFIWAQFFVVFGLANF